MEVNIGGDTEMMKIDTKMPDKLFGVEAWIFKEFWLPAGLAGLFLLTMVGVLSSKVGEINTTLVERQTVAQQISDLNQKRNYLLTLSEDDLKKKTELLSQALPADKNVYFLLTVVDSIAQKYDFTVSNFNVSPGKVNDQSKKDNVLSKVPVTVSLSGPSDSYLALITAIEQSLPILSIDQFKLSQTGLLAKLDLTVSTYFSNANTEVKVKNLTLTDLSMTSAEAATITNLASYTPLLNVNIGETSGEQFVRYDRSNPFEGTTTEATTITP